MQSILKTPSDDMQPNECEEALHYDTSTPYSIFPCKFLRIFLTCTIGKTDQNICTRNFQTRSGKERKVRMKAEPCKSGIM